MGAGRVGGADLKQRRAAMSDTTDVLATISPSPARRWVGIGLQAVLGGMIIWVALALPEGNTLSRVALLLT